MELSRDINRGLCYCRDCQAFAHFLGRADEVLDARGGTDVIQTAPRRVTLTQGLENLACMRLTASGLLRWYACCCHTPIGNTAATHRLAFVGLVHSCLRIASRSLDEAFGPVRMRVNTKSAQGSARPGSERVLGAILQLAGMMARERLTGSYRRTPFFSPDTGEPIVTPRVLSAEELAKLKSAVSGGSRT